MHGTTHTFGTAWCVCLMSLDKAAGEGGGVLGGGGEGRRREAGRRSGGAQLHQAVALICKFSQMTQRLRALTASSCISPPLMPHWEESSHTQQVGSRLLLQHLLICPDPPRLHLPPPPPDLLPRALAISWWSCNISCSIHSSPGGSGTTGGRWREGWRDGWRTREIGQWMGEWKEG